MGAAKKIDPLFENESDLDAEGLGELAVGMRPSGGGRAREKSGKSFQLSEQDIGPADMLRSTILTLTFDEQYERATSELKAYVESRTAYPSFQDRVARYVKHCTDLIQAIKIKRSVQGSNFVAKSKEQDLTQRVHQHFDELKQSLQRIERIERQLRLEDLRSTVWVLRAAVYSLFVIIAAYIWQQASAGGFHTLYIFVNSEMSQVTNQLLTHFKF